MKIYGRSGRKKIEYIVDTGFDKQITAARKAIDTFSKEVAASMVVTLWIKIDGHLMPVIVDSKRIRMPNKKEYRNVFIKF